ncbi:MAG: hypothetical protein QF911_05060 [Candidatus Thalassarchaeaceae archaeon]|nr:hypothetical protein [Candidatus Thalassarchaeaceae archaeon]
MDEPKPSGRTLKIFLISACVAFWPMFAFGDYIGVNPASLGPLILTIPAGIVTLLVCLRTEFHSGGKWSYFFTISGFVLIGLALYTLLVMAMEGLGGSGDATGPDRVPSLLTFTILGISAIIAGIVVAWFEYEGDSPPKWQLVAHLIFAIGAICFGFWLWLVGSNPDILPIMAFSGLIMERTVYKMIWWPYRSTIVAEEE